MFIGQKVVCVDVDDIVINDNLRQPKDVLTKNYVYTVKGIRKCKCGRTSVDVGIKSAKKNTHCKCGKVFICENWYFSSDRFEEKSGDDNRQKVEECADIVLDKHVVTVRIWKSKTDEYMPKGSGDSVAVWIEDGDDHIRFDYNYKRKSFEFHKSNVNDYKF